MQQATFKYINYLQVHFILLIITLMQKNNAHDASKHIEVRERHAVHLHIKYAYVCICMYTYVCLHMYVNSMCMLSNFKTSDFWLR